MTFQQQIFMSYAREDRTRIAPLVNILMSHGWYVWWDKIIPTGSDYQQITSKEIEAARAIVVVWSKDSVGSRWVRSEAEAGLARNILVPVRLDDATIPVRYNLIQTADLSGWRGQPDHPELTKLIHDIGELAGGAGELGKRVVEHSKAQRKPEAHDSHVLADGTEIGAYRTLGLLGQGGFGITYLAEHMRIPQRVAIKEYLPTSYARRSVDGATVKPLTSAKSEDFKWGLERFRREAETLVRLPHPNIVKVLNFFEANGTAYMVMEYEDGSSLEDYLKPDKKLENFALLGILPGLLSGLDAVHKANVFHRDIKPANIFIRGDGEPVLLDFGAAREAIAKQSQTISEVLTPGYAPPEQYESKGRVGAWSDLYALGATLYRCMTGHPPADAAARANAQRARRVDPVAGLTAAAKGEYDQKLCAAVTAALNLREEKRPQSVAAFRKIAQIARRPFSGAPRSSYAEPPSAGSASSRQPPKSQSDSELKRKSQAVGGAFVGVLRTAVTVVQILVAGVVNLLRSLAASVKARFGGAAARRRDPRA